MKESSRLIEPESSLPSRFETASEFFLEAPLLLVAVPLWPRCAKLLFRVAFFLDPGANIGEVLGDAKLESPAGAS
jgi:hypothetical protein